MFHRTPHKGEIEYAMRDDDRNRAIIYMVPYACYPIIPATWTSPEEGGPETDGGDVIAISFLDSDGEEVGMWSLAANTLTQAEADAIEKHYEKSFAMCQEEILAEAMAYEREQPEQDPDDPNGDY